MPKPFLPKRERIRIFLERLAAAAPAASDEEAKQMIDRTLNTVEDELTDVTFDPANWRSDGRLYPALDDSASDVDGYPDVTSFRSKGHETFVRKNGAFEIRDLESNEVVLSKPGVNGLGVWT